MSRCLTTTTTAWTSSTARGNAVALVTDGKDPETPVDALHEMVQVTRTDPGHSIGRPSTPVRKRYV
jgi:hypothetical protein